MRDMTGVRGKDSWEAGTTAVQNKRAIVSRI